MRRACLVWLIAGCGFSGGPAEPGGGPGSGSGSGSANGSGGTGTTSDCDVTGATLRLCVSFGGNPMAQDLLVPPHVLVDATGIAPIDGILNSVAGNFGTGSRLRFAESPDFDVTDLTLSFWMRPSGTPSGGKRVWMVDNNTQYFATYEDNGAVRCGIGSQFATSQATVSPGTWHHVACTYSPTAGDQKIKVYVDGDLSGCKAASAIPHTGKDGVAIGASYDPTPKPLQSNFQQHFAGSIGHLHVYGIELTADQICGAAGRTGCSQSCSGGEGGGSEGG
jgi:concanavalin A-like lectin/glucanase superfamily protein